MSELADRNFEITIINMLKKLQEKRDVVSKEMGEFQRRCKNCKKEPNKNDKIKKKKHIPEKHLTRWNS